MRPFRVIAIMSAFNEEDIISPVIGHLVANNIDVYLLDNLSTDDTVEQARQWEGKGLAGIERFPSDVPDDVDPRSMPYDWTSILLRKEQLARELHADWFIHHDADEIREAPWPGMSLWEAIEWVDRLDYNAINFKLLNFFPTDEGFQKGDEPKEHFVYYKEGEVFDNLQIKCWKNTGQHVSLAASGGHDVSFERRRVFPIQFLLRHYPIRGQGHGQRKVFDERKGRFLEEERKRGWHVQYDKLTDESHRFVKDITELVPYRPDHVRLNLLLNNELTRAAEQELEMVRKEQARLNDEYVLQIEVLENWIEQLLDDSEASFASLRWRIGSVIARIAELVMFRRRSDTAREHINKVAVEYRSWKKNISVPNGAVDLTVSKETPQASLSKFSAHDFLVATVRNPKAAAKLLTPQRIWNFFVTCFRQPEHVRREIFRHYLMLYSSHYNSDVGDRRFRNRRRPLPISFPRVEAPVVTVIVYLSAGLDKSIPCLSALEESSRGLNYQVFLNNVHSNAIEKYFENVQVICSGESGEYPGNCDAIIRATDSPYIFFMEDTCVVDNDCLRLLVDRAEADNYVGIIMPKLLLPDGRLQEAGSIVCADGSLQRYGYGMDPAGPEYNYIKEADCSCGGAFLIRREFWKRSGGFDTRYSSGPYRKVDLAFQARRLGFKVVYQPKAVITCSGNISLGAETIGDSREQLENKIQFLNKWGGELGCAPASNESVFLARDRRYDDTVVLVVDAHVPEFDKDAGSRSTLQYLQLLVQQGLCVKFLPHDFHDRKPYTSVLEQLGVEVLYGDRYRHGWQRWWRENSQFIDIVYLHRPNIAKEYIYEFRRAPNVKIIYFGHDLHYLRLERQYEVERSPALRIAAKKWRDSEFRIIEKSDVVYFPSKTEAQTVRRFFPGKTVRNIPLYIIEPLPEPVARFEQREGIFLLGGFRHPPNVDGALWFIKQVLPIIEKSLPGIEFVIAGSRIPEEICSMADKRIVVKGWISDDKLAKLYSQVRVVVVPLRFGAGMKGKLLEALQHRVPVVTTSIGAEGLPDPLNYIALGDDAQAFARAVVKVYTDSTEWAKLSKRGAEIIEKHFSQRRAVETVGADFGF